MYNYIQFIFQILLEDLENQRPAIAAADEAVKRLLDQGVEDPAEGGTDPMIAENMINCI